MEKRKITDVDELICYFVKFFVDQKLDLNDKKVYFMFDMGRKEILKNESKIFYLFETDIVIYFKTMGASNIEEYSKRIINRYPHGKSLKTLTMSDLYDILVGHDMLRDVIKSLYEEYIRETFPKKETKMKVVEKEEKKIILPLPLSFKAFHTSFENLFIGIAGVIGAGKTTLAKSLSELLNIPVYYEPIKDNVYLDDFYKDMTKYGFKLQIYLLNRRFEQHQQIIWSGKGGVIDRTIYEDSIFCKVLMENGHMEERDYETYVNLFSNMSNLMKKPNLIVYLDVKPEEAMERITVRARGCETGITIEYLQKLYDAYEVFLSDISRVIPVIRVDWNTFKTTEEMASKIKEQWLKISHIHTIEWTK